jgi:ATP-dependent Lhr-like helicase
MDNVINPIEQWFAGKGWQPFDFQREAWQAYLDGASGLIHASTGTGKTYAAWLGPVMQWMSEQEKGEERRVEDGLTPLPSGRHVPEAQRKGEGQGVERAASKKHFRASAPALRVLWITPLRALAGDTEAALSAPVTAMGLPWTIERRTGDTASSLRAKQRERLPTALITTPESLSLMLSWPGARERFDELQCVIVDEWHELLSTKRGTQVELALARLRHWQPALRTWGLSATLGNLEMAAHVLLGSRERREESAEPISPLSTFHSPLLIRGAQPKSIVIDSLIPLVIEKFPWAGHLGLVMLPAVIAAIEENQSTLVFTNTRSQTETWYHALLDARPDWAGEIALHHGSLDKDQRSFVEQQLKEGKLRAVVCTSSLDLGVDFTPVDRVLQIGSPKGVARLLQRAGRSGHQPGRPSRVTCVPTHALELIEVAAARDAINAGHIESRPPIDKPLDVLAQHVVTVAAGGGFRRDELLEEVRTTFSYRNLSDEAWQWVIEFVTRGGRALNAYPEFKRVVEDDGFFKVEDDAIAKRHRQSIGTIVSDASLVVQFQGGAKLGTIEESFVSWLKAGECFLFAGRLLEFIRLHDNTVWVKRATKKRPAIPRWMGTRMPLSTELSRALRKKLEEARDGELNSPEMWAVQPILQLQMQRSSLPAPGELLIERAKTREGHHLFVFPFDGRAVHEGMAAILAYRLSRIRPVSFSFSINDYGFELLSADEIYFHREGAETQRHGEFEVHDSVYPLLRDLFSPENLAHDLVASLNATALAKRQFREIARIAGLIFEGLPHQRKTSRQMQASSGLFYEVFTKYDPDNLLIAQANREVMEKQLENSRLANAMQRAFDGNIILNDVPKPTPLAFPLMVDLWREQLSSESLADRVRKMQAQWAD